MLWYWIKRNENEMSRTMWMNRNRVTAMVSHGVATMDNVVVWRQEEALRDVAKEQETRDVWLVDRVKEEETLRIPSGRVMMDSGLVMNKRDIRVIFREEMEGKPPMKMVVT